MYVRSICSQCNLEKPVSGSWCRSCRSKAETIRRRQRGQKLLRRRNPKHAEQGKKECFKCNKILSQNKFSPAKKGNMGLTSWCRNCMNNYQKEPKRRARHTEYTREYRINNPHYTVYHRGQQLKRRMTVLNSTDGSVTVEFLKILYSYKNCYYCEKYTCKNKRTADHKTPLSRGGRHAASNLVMACQSCNSSKRNKTEAEFRSYVRSKNSR